MILEEGRAMTIYCGCISILDFNYKKHHGISLSLNMLPISAPTINLETRHEGRYANGIFCGFHQLRFPS